MSDPPSLDVASAPRTAPWYRGALVAVAWLVLGAAMIYCMLVCDFSLNLFDWRGRWSVETSLACGVYAAAFVASVLLYRATRGALALSTAMLATMGIALIGLFLLPPETLDSGWFGRKIVSPFEYRAVRAAILLLPGLALLVQWVLRVPRRVWS